MKFLFKPHFKYAPVAEAGADGGSGSASKSAEDAIIEKIKLSVAEQVRSLQGDEDHKKTVEGVFTKLMNGMTVDQLRKMEENSEKLKLDLGTVSAQLEKINQRSANVVTAKSTDNFVKAMLEHRFSEIEAAINAKNAAVEFNFNARAAAIITTENAVSIGDLTAEDLKDGLSITNFVEKRRSRQYIFEIADRVTVAKIDKLKTWLSEGNEEGAFAIVEESALKPMVSIGLVANASKVKKVAGHTVYTDEVPKFQRDAYNIIRRLINDKLLRDYQNQLTTELLVDAAPYVASALDGQYSNPTDYHAIAAVAAQIEGLEFYPDTLILNPQDKWRIGMSQDQTGAFYMAIPASSPDASPQLLGFNVITSTKIEVGNFILGESGLWKIEDEGVTIKIGYGTTVIKDETGTVTDVEDDLTHNRFRVISEMFYHSYIDQSHLGSFVYGNFDVIKELLVAPAPAG